MDSIRQQVLGLTPSITALRRDLHQRPETAWTEYRTAAMVARHLLDLGYAVRMGADAVCADARLAPPSATVCAAERQRAIQEGAEPALVARMGEGLTGLWGDLHCPGPEENSPHDGPVVALRFDMDANGIAECAAADHRPAREGFASLRRAAMHACGHDGHTAIGMGVAAILTTLRRQLHGTVRLIFQPAEEGGQGGRPMCEAGALDGVDVLFGLHLGIRAERIGQLVCGTSHFLATTTFEMHFAGQAAHAGMLPQEGRNALLAACAAVQAMHAISRHSDGASRINVGQLHADGAPNVIPAHAWLAGETRGLTSEIDQFMMREVERMGDAAARMWNCDLHARRISQCPSGSSSPELVARVAEVARSTGLFTDIIPSREFWASEDFTWMLNRVQEQGGQGTYIQLGTERPAGHHADRFDFDEAALAHGMELLTRMAADCLKA